MIFGSNIKELEEECRNEEIEPTYGSVENDVMIQSWEDFHDPIIEFKKEGLYGKLKTLIHSSKISGTYYRIVDEHEHFEHLKFGDIIDYRSCVTEWTTDCEEEEFSIKLICENVNGLMISKNTIILGECILKVNAQIDKQIEVCI